MTPHEYAWVLISDVAVSAVVTYAIHDIRDAWRTIRGNKLRDRWIKEEHARLTAETADMLARSQARQQELAVERQKFDLRCFYCGFAKYYQDQRGGSSDPDTGVHLCRRCHHPVKWESADEEWARTQANVRGETVGQVEVRGETVSFQGPGEA